MAAKLANLGEGRPKNSANLQSSVSQADAAKMLNVSTRSVAAAAKVIHEGDDDLIHAVERDDIAVSRPRGGAFSAAISYTQADR